MPLATLILAAIAACALVGLATGAWSILLRLDDLERLHQAIWRRLGELDDRIDPTALELAAREAHRAARRARHQRGRAAS